VSDIVVIQQPQVVDQQPQPFTQQPPIVDPPQIVNPPQSVLVNQQPQSGEQQVQPVYFQPIYYPVYAPQPQPQPTEVIPEVIVPVGKYAGLFFIGLFSLIGLGLTIIGGTTYNNSFGKSTNIFAVYIPILIVFLAPLILLQRTAYKLCDVPRYYLYTSITLTLILLMGAIIYFGIAINGSKNTGKNTPYCYQNYDYDYDYDYNYDSYENCYHRKISFQQAQTGYFIIAVVCSFLILSEFILFIYEIYELRRVNLRIRSRLQTNPTTKS